MRVFRVIQYVDFMLSTLLTIITGHKPNGTDRHRSEVLGLT